MFFVVKDNPFLVGHSNLKKAAPAARQRQVCLHERGRLRGIELGHVFFLLVFIPIADPSSAGTSAGRAVS
jgi:hypothetical protein